MAESEIEWTDRSDWNPVRGCSRVSPGCGGPGNHGGCYAEGMAARFSQPGMWGHGFAEMQGGKPRWTGKVELQEDRLLMPLSWRKPAKVFPNSTSDFFHEALPDEAIDRLFAVMALCPHLTFQIPTKRAERMRAYLTTSGVVDKIVEAVRAIGQDAEGRSDAAASQRRVMSQDDIIGANAHAVAFNLEHGYPNPPWPLPNVWLGVSAERQQEADERIPHLLQTPAAVRFVSAEPLLGPIDFTRIRAPADPEDPEAEWLFDALAPGDMYEQRFTNALDEVRFDSGDGPYREHALDWIIVGGESGPRARPFHAEWADGIIEQCRAADVACFVKQMGSAPLINGYPMELHDRKGGDADEWPMRLAVRESPNPQPSSLSTRSSSCRGERAAAVSDGEVNS